MVYYSRFQNPITLPYLRGADFLEFYGKFTQILVYKSSDRKLLLLLGKEVEKPDDIHYLVTSARHFLVGSSAVEFIDTNILKDFPHLTLTNLVDWSSTYESLLQNIPKT